MIHLRPKDYRVMPWKDGGGVTTEIAIEPTGASVADAFAWRPSSARVEASGPFSRFPGSRRDLVLLEGAGFELSAGGRTLALRDFMAPVRFSGDEDAHATLFEGTSIDLGLIWDPKRVRAEVSPHWIGKDPLQVAPAPTTLLVAPWGEVLVGTQGPELGAMDTLRIDGTIPCPTVRAAGDAAPLVVVRVWPIT